jgi:hypothetical protein
MKKMIGLVILMVCLAISGQALARDNDVAAKTQVQLTIGHYFEVRENVTGVAFGSFLYNLNTQYPVALGYVGPMVKVGQINIYTMLAVMGEPIGMSVGPSLWLEYSNGKDSFFLEYDHYESWMSSQHGDDAVAPSASYYGLFDYSHNFGNKVSLGLACEGIGMYQDNHPYELAYGPYAQFNKFRIWLAYDETPNVPGQDYWLIRLRFGL